MEEEGLVGGVSAEEEGLVGGALVARRESISSEHFSSRASCVDRRVADGRRPACKYALPSNTRNS